MIITYSHMSGPHRADHISYYGENVYEDPSRRMYMDIALYYGDLGIGLHSLSDKNPMKILRRCVIICHYIM